MAKAKTTPEEPSLGMSMENDPFIGTDRYSTSGIKFISCRTSTCFRTISGTAYRKNLTSVSTSGPSATPTSRVRTAGI